MSNIYNAVGDKVGVGKHPNTQAVWPEHDLFTEYLPLQLGAIKSLRKFLTSGEGYESIEGLVHKRTVQRFLRFLVKDKDPELQHEAAHALADLAFWNIGLLIDDVPILVEHNRSEDDIIRNKAFGVLEKIARKSHQCCDMLLGNGAVVSLMKQLETQTGPSQLRQRNWTLSKLCRDQVIFAVAQLKRVYRDPLLDQPDVSWRCTSLYFLSECTNGELKYVRDADACEKLVALLEGDNFVAVEPVLGAIEAKVDIEDIQNAMRADVKIGQLCNQLMIPDDSVLSKALYELFTVLCQEEKNRSSCLETFAEAHGFDRLKELKLHENFSISKSAGLLLTLYYEEPKADESTQQSDAASQPDPCSGGSNNEMNADSGPVYVDSHFGALTSGSGDIDPSLYSPIHSPYGASGLGSVGIGPADDSPMGRLVYYSPTYHTGTGVLTPASGDIGSSAVAPSAAPTSGSGSMDPFAAGPSDASTSGSGGIGPSAVAPSAASTSGSEGTGPTVDSLIARLGYYSPLYHTGSDVLMSASGGIGPSAVASSASTSSSGGIDPSVRSSAGASGSGSGGIDPSVRSPAGASASGSGGMDPSDRSPAGASASEDSENIDP